ncbi:MAG: hypothetical protein LCH96_13235 [Actinobacteria bacterium]|nr:hypothetical protein [Actinomycetota bacterium]
MSAYVSFAPILERTAVENTSAFPEAPQVVEAATARPRTALAALLRRTADLELALAARLERRPAQCLAA